MTDLSDLVERLDAGELPTRRPEPQLPWDERRRKKPVVTIERLRALVHYDPTTGLFTWRTTRMVRLKAGQMCGGLNDGYVLIGLDGVRYRAHRLAWLYMTGEWPTPGFEVDHINRNRSDNRFANLRLANRSQNLVNSKTYTNNTSGFRGVSFHRASGLWKAVACDHYLGYFKTKEEAYFAYCRAMAKLHPGFTQRAPMEKPLWSVA
jgi:hypothetical protein